MRTTDKFEKFHKILVDIAKKCKRESIDEPTLYQLLLDKKFFELIGYTKKGIDIKFLRRDAATGKIPDFECLDDFEQSRVVFELKSPNDPKPLVSYRDNQLRDRYILPKKSRYGILYNGIQLIFYIKKGENLEEIYNFEDCELIESNQSKVFFRYLEKPSYDFTSVKAIVLALDEIEPKSLVFTNNRNSFYEIFKLKQDEKGNSNKFTELVFSLMDLFDELMTGEKSNFLEGAYKFWESTYAHKPSKIPENWKKLTRFDASKGEKELFKFMFCLETAHNIVAKLILSKVCEDFGLERVNALERLEAYMRLKFGEDSDVAYIAYPFAIHSTFEELKENLVESVFEEDIFDWWTDIQIKVGDRPSIWKESHNPNLLGFGEALAKTFFALRTFDFHEVQEDILGELYQQYFDPVTRKALGEFYTPTEVVDYILDAVDYNGKKILNQRLLDPSCGSGTFVVHALKKYLREAKKHEEKDRPAYWYNIINDLFEKPKIVGLDINPFACLMAQMRFMMEIIPYLKKAQEDAGRGLFLRTIPIFRTDSLEKEISQSGKQKTLTETEEDIEFSMTLPIIEKDTDRRTFHKIEFDVPNWDNNVRLREYLQGDKELYFILLRVTFTAIKRRVKKAIVIDQRWEMKEEELKNLYIVSVPNAGPLSEMMRPYADQIIKHIKILRDEYGDGRLIKSLEDLILAGILKNFFKYEYVVGNPPYVRVQTLPEEVKGRLKESYQTVIGKFDIYVPFIERGIDWLNEAGYLGYITPNLFFNRDYGKALRSYILQTSKISQIIDFGDSGVFKDATNYPCIITLEKGSTPEKAFKAVNISNPKEDILASIKENLDQEVFQDEYYNIFRVNQAELGEDSWKLMPRKMVEIFDKIELTGKQKLADITEKIYEGFITGANQIYFVDEQAIKKYGLEEGILKDVPKGRRVKAWRILPPIEKAIFPHKSTDGKTKAISLKELESSYPNAWEYLKKNEENLKKRHYLMNVIGKGQREYWYEIWNPRNFDWYVKPKIITPNLSTNNNFVYDDNGLFLDHDCYGIILKEKERSYYLFVLGLLNSKALEFYIKQISPFASGKYYRYMTGYLNQLPICLPQSKSEQKLADEITVCVEKILGLAKREQHIKNFPDSYFDELLDEIKEWKDVKWRPKRKYKEMKIEINTDLEGDRALIFGKDDMLAEPAINSETKEQYVIEVLKVLSVKKDEEISLKLPKSDAAVEKILRRLEEDKKTLEKEPISKLEDEINERVYKLYGLDENDIKVIEEFLEKF